LLHEVVPGLRRLGVIVNADNPAAVLDSSEVASAAALDALRAKAAQNEDLKAAFEKHEGETEQQVARLQRVFEAIEKKPQGKKCPAIDGIIEEGQEIIKEYKGSPALDSGLLAAAQAVEHYEIPPYETLRIVGAGAWPFASRGAA
jgi:ferritin-like metal-binding protein YciE